MSRRLPRSVRVMTLTAEVERTDKVEFDTADGGRATAFGFYSQHEPLIQIADDIGSEREKVTFVHENLHFMLDVADLADAYDSDERLVTRLAPVILSWLRENKAAIAYLQERA